MKLWKNKSNSCYIDSLLSILFLAKEGWFISKILCEEVNEIEYPPGIRTLTSKIDGMNKFASKVQTLLSGLFFDIQRKEHPNSLISFLSYCDTRIKTGNTGNPAEIYELLTSLFPSIQIHYRRKESDGNYDRSQALFDMTDFPLKKIISSPKLLVFSNGGIERFKGRINWAKRGFGVEIKHRMNIYELVGVIMHIGMCHYVSYYKVDDVWWYYDDLFSRSKRIENQIQEVFVDTPRQQPAMFFYLKKL